MKKHLISNSKLRKNLFIATVPVFFLFLVVWPIRGFSFKVPLIYFEIIEILIACLGLYCLSNNPKDGRKLTYIICTIHMSIAFNFMLDSILTSIQKLFTNLFITPLKYSIDEKGTLILSLAYIILMVTCIMVIYKTFNKNLTLLSLFITASMGITWLSIVNELVSFIIYETWLVLLTGLIAIPILVFASILIAKGKKAGWYIFIIGSSLGIWIETIDIRPLNIRASLVTIAIQVVIILIAVANLIHAYRHGSEVLWQGRKKKEVQQSLEQ